MIPLTRRRVLHALSASTAGLFLSQYKAAACVSVPASLSTASLAPVGPGTPYRGRLPLKTVFVGSEKFQLLCAKAKKENWGALPLSTRVGTVGRALLGTHYGNYTLEIDDHVEAPSVNFNTLDCWTFYETSLAFARMVHGKPTPWSEADMLHYIELERYRGGSCDGGYLSRMHHLEEVFQDNEHRGLGKNMTKSLGGVPFHRDIKEMQVAWKSYRYLRNNPELRGGIAKVEARVSNLPVTYIPKGKVAGIESQLQSGDVLAIASVDKSGYTSHVGLALRDGDTCHFMHATSMRDKGRRVVLDRRISQYLGEGRDHMGLIVFRPSEAA